MKPIRLTVTGALSCLFAVSQLIFDPNIKTAVAQQRISCQETIRSSEVRLMGDRPQDQIRPPAGVRGEIQNLNLITQIENISRLYQSYPPNRFSEVKFILGGSRGDNIMNSPTMMQEISQSIITNCSNAGTVSFIRRSSGWIQIYGIIDSQVTKFRCIGLPTGSEQRTAWGQHYCD